MTPPPSSRSRSIALIVACAFFMENLDATILATALPTIARAFGENPLKLNLAISCYLLGLAIFIPLAGWLADRFGARRVFRLAILLFVAGSVLCGLSQSLVLLVGARFLQGIGGAMMIPVGRIVLLRATAKAELIRTMTYLTVPALLGPVLGPPLGGFLTTYVDWRWIFWINLPIGLVGIILAGRFLPEDAPPPPRRFDLGGFLLLALGITTTIAGFETVGRFGLPLSASGGTLLLGLSLLLAYARHAGRVPEPVVDLKLLRLPSFRQAALGGFLFRVAIGAIPFLLPLLLQLGLGLSAFRSGLLTFVSGIGAIGLKLIARSVLARFGFRRVLIANALLCGLTLAAYGFIALGLPDGLVLGLLLCGGFVRSLQFTAVNTLGLADVEAADQGHAATFNGIAQQVSLSVGVGLGALLLHALQTWRGGSLAAMDFVLAFLAVGLLAALSGLCFLPLAEDAGAAVSGHKRPPPAPPAGD